MIRQRLRNDHSWIDDGREIQHRRGVAEIPGLYFLGLQWQYTRGSALLGWVKDDAEYLAKRVAAYDPAQRQVGRISAHTGA